MRIGCHLSIGDGLMKVAATAAELGCNSAQIFSRSPRGGRAKALKNEELAKFRIKLEEHDIDPLVVHMPYFINLASPEEEMRRSGISLVSQDLERADLLGARYFVLHTGSHRGAGVDIGMENVANALNEIFETAKFECTILLENMAGSGSEIGVKFEELGLIIEKVNKKEQIGVCLDTCHAFAAGYDWTSKESTDKNLKEFDEKVGISYLKLIHANDSLHPVNSRKDRHANIGQGFIGQEGFDILVNHELLRGIPLILETPHEGVTKDLQIMKNLVQK